MIRKEFKEISTVEKGVCREEANYECKMDEGTTLPLIMDEAEKQLLTMMVEDGNAIPGQDTFEISEATVSMNSIEVPQGVEINFNKKLDRSNRRKIVTKLGNAYYLIVRVINVNGLAHSDEKTTMNHKNFGIINDTVSMKSKVYDCSAGQLNAVLRYPDSASERVKFAIDAVTVDQGHPVGFMEANINLDITAAINSTDI